MPGAKIDVQNVIGLIKGNLQDRYDSGFPVLKEIIQNADDAKADQLVMGWSQGVNSPVNPLLADPGLFFINNAPLKEEHADGIMSVAGSSKNDEKGAVGKFGLGMKSLFHICEAFFFIDQSWGENNWAANVFNPRDKYCPEWDTFCDSDKQKMQKKLSTLLDSLQGNGSASWFVVWVPLRTQEQIKFLNNVTIMPNYEKPGHVPDFLTKSTLPGKIADIFPLLKSLRHVQMVIESNGSFEQRFAIELKKDSCRSAFNGEPQLSGSSTSNEWAGHVQINNSGVEAEIQYAGVESLLNRPELLELKCTETAWPTSLKTVNGRLKDVLDKAEQHTAVVITRTPSKEGEAKVTASWAVFLPLAETHEFEISRISGKYDYHIYLHGYFFVDAGRKGIDGHQEIGDDADFEGIDGDQKRLRKAWNLTLASSGTLEQLLPSLNYFISSFPFKQEDIDSVSKGFKTIFPEKYLERATNSYHWVYRLRPSGQAWELIEGNNKTKLIPKPVSDYDRVWSTFPWLASKADEVIFAQSDKNNILPSSGICWSLHELQQVLDIDVSEVFTSHSQFSYFNAFLRESISPELRESVQPLLIKIAREALETNYLSALSGHKKQFQTFLAHIYSGRRLALPVNKEDSEIWSVLCEIQIDTLIIPDFLDSLDYPSSAPVDVEEAILILKKLDSLLKIKNEDYLIKSTQELIKQIVYELGKYSKEDLEYLYQRCGDCRLFSVYNYRIKKNELRSRNELQNFSRLNRAFLYNSGIDCGIGEQLHQAAPGIDFYFLSRKVAELAYGSRFDDIIQECNSESVLLCLSQQPELGSEEKRVSLIHNLSSGPFYPETVKGFRYLLHGSVEDKGLSDLWVSESNTTDVWLKILQVAYGDKLSPWVVIPQILGQELTPKIKSELRIVDISAGRVLNELGDKIAEIDFSKMNLSSLDIEEVLLKIDNEKHWCKLPLHKTVDGNYIAIDALCVLEGQQEIPDDFDVTQICRSANMDLFNRQKDHIGEAGAELLIRIALHQDEPCQHAAFILNQLGQLHKKGSKLPGETVERLVQISWLNTKDGEAVSLNRVLYLDQEKWPSVFGLCERESTGLYSQYQLDFPDGESHLASTLNPYLKTPKEGQRLLMKEAATKNEYFLGEIGELSDNLIANVRACQDIETLLPGWELVRECHINLGSDFDVKETTPLLKEVAGDTLIAVLQQLSEVRPADTVYGLRKEYLSAMCKLENPVSYLEQIDLRTKANTYRKSTSLVGELDGVCVSHTVHPDELKVIKEVIDCAGAEYPGNQGFLDQNDLEIAEILRNYFRLWEAQVPHDSIATFLTLLSGSGEVRSLAESFFRNRTLKGTKDEMGAKWNDRGRGEFSGYPWASVIASASFSLSVIGDDQTEAHSIFGERIQVPLKDEKNLDSILILNKAQSFSSSKTVKLGLRQINPDNYERDDLLKILQNSSEQIIREVFGQNISLGNIWSDLSESNQMDIKLAQRIILDNVVQTLRRYKVTHGEVDVLIQKYVEAQKNSCAHNDEQGFKRLSEIKKEIQVLIRDDQELQDSILQRVRHEIGHHSQYFPDSVPFELFQNADDALGEKKEMEGVQVPGKFVVRYEASSKALSFYHWGREVNYCSSGYDKGKGKFDRDIEKMVSLNISDKGDNVTGKFGLGFKSCLLVSDSPEISSGELAFNIQGGILPVISDNAELLAERVNKLAIEGQRPTLTRLPLMADCNAEDILSRFKMSAGLLCVFSRHIRAIEVDGDEVSWNPRPSSRIEGLSFGKARLPHDGALQAQRVVHYRTDTGQFLFQINADGLLSLENRELSKFWVLNPLQETLSAGFIIESDFQVDIGRSQLAANNDINARLMGNLGRELAGLLTDIYSWINEDWSGFRIEWGLKEQLEPTQFWNTVWHVLTTAWPNESKSVLHRALFTSQGGLLDFYNQYAAVPNKLGSGSPTLMTLSNVEYRADNLLTVAFSDVAQLPTLLAYADNGSLVCDSIGHTLNAIQQDKAIEPLGLFDVIEKHTGDGFVHPENAEILGKLFNEHFDRKLENASIKDHVELKKSLRRLCFKSNRNTWLEAERLVSSSTEVREEDQLVAGFAPAYGLINSAYNRTGLNFYYFCCDKSPKPDVESWAAEIPGTGRSRKEALLRYLITSPNGRKLAGKIKFSHRPAWIWDINEAVLKEWDWENRDIDEYVRLMIETDDQIERRVNQGIRNCRTHMAPDQALQRVHEWWQKEKGNQLPKYDQRLYSQMLPWDLMKEDDELIDQETRKGWLKLLFLGSCQTMGLFGEGHHREAIEWMEQKGWWDKMALSPRLPAEEWMSILDEYLLGAEVNERYRVWLQVLPLYRFAENLEKYAHMFLSLDRIPHLDDVLKSGSSPLWQGSDISAPELKATLGIGVNFIIRELIRHGVISEGRTQEWAFTLSGKVRRVVSRMGFDVYDRASPYESERVFTIFSEQLGNDYEKATFEQSFDIPFRILADNQDTLMKVLEIGSLDMEEAEY